jgi:type IV fimbrial biogenesis protein FimT
MKTDTAFSLFEMLVTLSIAMMLIAITLPLLQPIWRSFQHKMLQQQLLRAIKIASQEARILHQPISVCKTEDNRTCSGNWIKGQIIFVDKKEDGIIHHPKQILLKRHMPASLGMIHWRSFPLDRDYLLFLPSRLTQQENGTFWYCDEAASAPAWAIILSKSGRTRTVYPNRDGVIKDGSGQALRCDTSHLNL